MTATGAFDVDALLERANSRITEYRAFLSGHTDKELLFKERCEEVFEEPYVTEKALRQQGIQLGIVLSMVNATLVRGPPQLRQSNEKLRGLVFPFMFILGFRGYFSPVAWKDLKRRWPDNFIERMRDVMGYVRGGVTYLLANMEAHAALSSQDTTTVRRDAVQFLVLPVTELLVDRLALLLSLTNASGTNLAEEVATQLAPHADELKSLMQKLYTFRAASFNNFYEWFIVKEAAGLFVAELAAKITEVVPQSSVKTLWNAIGVDGHSHVRGTKQGDIFRQIIRPNIHMASIERLVEHAAECKDWFVNTYEKLGGASDDLPAFDSTLVWIIGNHREGIDCRSQILRYILLEEATSGIFLWLCDCYQYVDWESRSDDHSEPALWGDLHVKLGRVFFKSAVTSAETKAGELRAQRQWLLTTFFNIDTASAGNRRALRLKVDTTIKSIKTESVTLRRITSENGERIDDLGAWFRAVHSVRASLKELKDLRNDEKYKRNLSNSMIEHMELIATFNWLTNFQLALSPNEASLESSLSKRKLLQLAGGEMTPRKQAIYQQSGAEGVPAHIRKLLK